MTNRPDMPSDVWSVASVLDYLAARRTQNDNKNKQIKFRKNE